MIKTVINFNNWSLYWKFLLVFVPVFTLCCSAGLYLIVDAGARQSYNQLSARIGNKAGRVLYALNRNIADISNGHNQELIDILMVDSAIECVEYGIAGAGKLLLQAPRSLGCKGQKRHELIRFPSENDENTELIVRYSVDEVDRLIQSHREFSLAVLIAALGIALVSSAVGFRAFVGNPLNRLLHGIRCTPDRGSHQEIPISFNDEIATLTRAYNETQLRIADFNANLESMVRERTTDALLAVTEADSANEKLRVEIEQKELVQRKLIETNSALQVAANAKTEFLANMSHELRTPLNGVLGALELIQISNSEIERDELRSTAMESGNILLQLIDDILDFTKLDNGTLNFVPTSIDLADVVKVVGRSLRPIAKQKNLDLNVDVDGETPKYVIADGHRLRQVLINLVGNALKFTPSGKVTLRTRVMSHSTDDVVIRFIITDTGPGIPTDQHSVIFDRFKVADASHSRRSEGAGLGLSISSQLVSVMGGKINLVSQENCGSCFWFELSFRISDREYNCSDVTEQQAINFDRSLRVLLAEDNDTNALVTTQFVRSAGHHVERVRNGLEAVEISQHQAFDIILMDISMPEMDGITATEQIRSHEGKNQNIPILALTAQLPPEQGWSRDAVGLSGYTTKPIRRVKLLEAIRSHTSDSVEDGTNVPDQVEPTEPTDWIEGVLLHQLESEVGGDAILTILRTFSGQLNSMTSPAPAGNLPDDIEALGALMHRLKGGAATVGATRLAQLAHDVEMQCDAGRGISLKMKADLLKAVVATAEDLQVIENQMIAGVMDPSVKQACAA